MSLSYLRLLSHSLISKVISSKSDSTAESIVLAATKDLDIETAEEGIDYFIRIVDVVKLLNQRRNGVESTAADQYRRAISRPDFRRMGPPNWLTRSSPKLDKTWSDKLTRGGKHFLNKTVSIGEDYQASTIPLAGSFKETTNASSNA
jgi:hypothetical protein